MDHLGAIQFVTGKIKGKRSFPAFFLLGKQVGGRLRS